MMQFYERAEAVKVLKKCLEGEWRGRAVSTVNA